MAKFVVIGYTEVDNAVALPLSRPRHTNQGPSSGQGGDAGGIGTAGEQLSTNDHQDLVGKQLGPLSLGVGRTPLWHVVHSLPECLSTLSPSCLQQ